MFVKPAVGLKVRDPDLLDLLPDEGRDVPRSEYWLRRLRDKDVSLLEQAAASTSSPSAQAEDASA